MKLHDDSSSICFGLKNDNYGVIKVQQQMETMHLKLVHRSGTMGYGNYPDNYFGYSNDQLAVYITNKNDEILAPGGTYGNSISQDYLYSYLPNESEVIMRMIVPVFLRKNEELRLWFSMDLKDLSVSSDNTICADVYGWGKIIYDSFPC